MEKQNKGQIPIKVKAFSNTERSQLNTTDYLQIETEFHDNYADSLDWNEPLSEHYSYNRADGKYGLEAEETFVNWLGDVQCKSILDIGSGHGNTALKLAQRGGGGKNYEH